MTRRTDDPAEKLADEFIRRFTPHWSSPSAIDCVKPKIIAAIRRYYPAKRNVSKEIVSRLEEFTSDLESGADIRKKYRFVEFTLNGETYRVNVPHAKKLPKRKPISLKAALKLADRIGKPPRRRRKRK